MDIRTLRDEMSERLERIEEKLDKYALELVETKTEVNWIKGSIKFGLTAIVTLGTALIGYLFR